MSSRNQSQNPRRTTRIGAGQHKRRAVAMEVGQSSNPPEEVGDSVIDRNFDDDLSKLRFIKSFQTKAIKAGRVVNFVALNSVQFPYYNELEYQGWVDYLKMDILHYPELVRVFYANGDNSYLRRGKWVSLTDKFKTNVNGVEIEITPDVIDRICGFPTDGIKMGDLDMTNVNNLDTGAIIYPPKLPGKRNESSVCRFSFHDRLLHMIISSTLRPVGLKYSEFDNEQLCFMLHIKRRERISLSSFIVHDMTKLISGKGKTLYYGMLITRILEHFNVDLSMDDGRKGNDKRPIGDEAFNKTDYVKVGDAWVRDDIRVEQVGEHAQEAFDDQEAQGGATQTQEETQDGPAQRTIDDVYNLMIAQGAQFQAFNQNFEHFSENVTTQLEQQGVRISALEEGFRSFHMHLPPPQ